MNRAFTGAVYACCVYTQLAYGPAQGPMPRFFDSKAHFKAADVEPSPGAGVEQQGSQEGPERRNPVNPKGSTGFLESGRQDLNLRPLGPEGSAPFADGLAATRRGPDSVDNSEAASESAPDRVVPNGPIRPESWAPVGRADLVLGVDRMLTVKEVAARLHVCRATVYAMVERGELPRIRVGSAVRFDPAVLAAALERQPPPRPRRRRGGYHPDR